MISTLLPMCTDIWMKILVLRFVNLQLENEWIEENGFQISTWIVL
jgi:hypothetical protein